MATANLLPTANTTPDQGSTSAVSSASNTGHGLTSTAATATGLAPSGSDSASQAKSCRWSSFQSLPSGTVTSLRLQFTYSIAGEVTADAASDGLASASASFAVEYTLNGGSNWTSVASDSGLVTGNNTDSIGASGSADIALSTSQTVSQVQVRVRYDASVDVTAGTVEDSSAEASVDATISGIQLAVVTVEAATVIVVI